MFSLPQQLTIAQMQESKVNIIAYIDDNEEIILSSEEVEKVDTLGIQLLLATVIYASGQNKKLTWVCDSEVIKNGIKQLGINDALLNQYITN